MDKELFCLYVTQNEDLSEVYLEIRSADFQRFVDGIRGELIRWLNDIKSIPSDRKTPKESTGENYLEELQEVLSLVALTVAEEESKTGLSPDSANNSYLVKLFKKSREITERLQRSNGDTEL